MFNILIILLMAAFFWVLGMLVFSFTRDKRETTCFAIFNGALLFYILGYIVELNATSISGAMVGLRIENLGIPLVAPFFCLTAISLFHPKLLRTWMIIASLAYGIFIFLVVFFNDNHHLYYSSLEMAHNGVFYFTKLGKGPIYILQQSIVMLLTVLVYYIMTMRFIHGSAKLRSRMLLFFISSVCGVLANISNVLQLVPLGIDPTPFSMVIGMMIFALNIRKNNLMEIIPAAFGMAVESMEDALIILDDEWCFVHCNEKAKQLFPDLNKFSGTEDIIKVKNWPAELVYTTEEKAVFSLIDPMTEQIILNQAKIENVYKRQGKKIGISIKIHDITDITNMVNRLEELAVTDSLTGIFNRRHFKDLIEKQLKLAECHDFKIGLLMFDLDHFKQVNDIYGHLAGDLVLCKVVAAVTKQLGPQDVVARYGGEEFIVLPNDCVDEKLVVLAERLRIAISKAYIEFNGKNIPITASFGAITILPGQTYEAAIAAMDKALYSAKNNGRNQVVLSKHV